MPDVASIGGEDYRVGDEVVLIPCFCSCRVEVTAKVGSITSSGKILLGEMVCPKCGEKEPMGWLVPFGGDDYGIHHPSLIFNTTSGPIVPVIQRKVCGNTATMVPGWDKIEGGTSLAPEEGESLLSWSEDHEREFRRRRDALMFGK
jgi:hypothetical protein